MDNVVSVPQLADPGGIRPPQIEALTLDTRLVTVTVGGNDFSYLRNLIIYSCQAALADSTYQPLPPGPETVCNVSGRGGLSVDQDAADRLKQTTTRFRNKCLS